MREDNEAKSQAKNSWEGVKHLKCRCRTHTCAHTYIHSHTNTHIHTHIHIGQGMANSLLRRAFSPAGRSLSWTLFLHVIQGGGKTNSLAHQELSLSPLRSASNKLAQRGELQGIYLKPELKRKLLWGNAVLLLHAVPSRATALPENSCCHRTGRVVLPCLSVFTHTTQHRCQLSVSGHCPGSTCFAWFKPSSLETKCTLGSLSCNWCPINQQLSTVPSW